MRWPSETDCRRIAKVWALVNDRATSAGDRDNAQTALKQLRDRYELNDVALAYIAEMPHEKRKEVNAFDVVLAAVMNSKIILTFEQQVVVTLWILHTYVYDCFLHTPRLLVESHEPGCGKTALGHLVEALACNSDFGSSVSPAVFYHTLRKFQHTTFIFDEIENSTLWAYDKVLLNVFDSGHRKGGVVKRIIKGEVIKFPVFAPLMMIGVREKKFPPQLLSRSISIHMERHRDGSDEIDPDDPKFEPVCAVLSRWAGEFQRPEKCELPRGLVGREGVDNWRCLIEIADTLGYSATVRAVASAMHQPAANPVVRLLRDIRRVFEVCAVAGLWTEDLLTALHQLPDARWDEYGLDEGMAPRKLDRKDLLTMLRTKGIRTRDVWKRINGGERTSRKGFYRKDFEPMWRQLFGDIPTQPNKIIELPRHSERHSGATGGETEEVA
jgi:Protein of unknown function (DUF3631)